MARHTPLIGVVSDRRLIGPHIFQMVGEKYLAAVVDGAGAYPVGLPSLGGGFEVLGALGRLDGLLMTGSPSNVRPGRYGGPPAPEGVVEDPERDEAALALIPAAVRSGLPLLAICRGFQEMNVAFGGTLHQAVHDVSGLDEHRENKDADLDIQYGPAHEVTFTPGGVLARITGCGGGIVNSLHSQGIDRPGDGLDIEAMAPDGLIEAISVKDAPGFALGVQWHPEWKVTDNGLSVAIFQAFGDACRRYRS